MEKFILPGACDFDETKIAFAWDSYAHLLQKKTHRKRFFWKQESYQKCQSYVCQMKCNAVCKLVGQWNILIDINVLFASL